MTRIGAITVPRKAGLMPVHIMGVVEDGELRMAQFELKKTFFRKPKGEFIVYPYVRYERTA